VRCQKAALTAVKQIRVRIVGRRTQELREPWRLSIVLDGDEYRIQKDENYHEPVESLALDKATYAKPAEQHTTPARNIDAHATSAQN